MITILIIIILLFVLPSIYGIRAMSRSKRKRKIQAAVALACERLIKKHKLAIEHTDILNGKAIALDRKNKKLLLIHHDKTICQEVCIPLADIGSCRIAAIRDEMAKCVKRIMIELKHKRINKQTSFCFYDDRSDDITDMPSLSRKAKRWKHRIDLHKYPGNVNFEMEYVL